MKVIFKINSNSMKDVFLASELTRAVFNYTDHDNISNDYSIDDYTVSIEFGSVDWRVFSKLETLHKLFDKLDLLVDLVDEKESDDV